MQCLFGTKSSLEIMVTQISCEYIDLNELNPSTIITRHIVISMVSCQKGPTRHAYAWLIGPFWQDTLDMKLYKWCSFSST